MTRFVSPLSTTLAALLVGAFAVPAAAQFAKPDDAIKYRKAVFDVMSTHFGRVAAMAAGKVPFDAKAAAANAEIATTLSKLPFAAFVPGSDNGNTKADPKIWSERDKFDASAKTMQDAMAKLDVAAKAGNLDEIKAAVGETGKSCKSCHDNFRKE